MAPQRTHGPGTLRRLGVLIALWLASVAAVAELHGRVLYNGFPVPGATVTVTHGDAGFSTVTDSQGVYEFPDLSDGAWKIRIEMRGFAVLDGNVTVAPNASQGEWELKLLGLDQLLAETHEALPEAPVLQPRVANAAKPAGNTAAKPDQGSAAPAPTPEPDEGEHARDGLLINGSESNAATSAYSLSPAFGNKRAGTKSLYTGSVGAIADNSVFDARPYSLTGLQVPKDAYNRITVVVTLGGPIRIPHLLYHGPNFFVAYQATRDRDATAASGLVPDAAERAGDLSGLLNPATGQPFPGPIPVSPQAQALLALYPLPNVAGNSPYNYQTDLLSNTHGDALQSRLDKTIGRRDQIYGGFGFQSVRANSVNLFNFLDTTNTLGLDTNVNWSHRFMHQILLLSTYHFTRLRTEVRPNFDNRENVSGQDGITGNDQDSADWGPPELVFSSITTLNDVERAFNRNRTDSVSFRASTTHGLHTVVAGGDFRRQEFNVLSQQNPRGVFTFDGEATGLDFVDFLSGIPDASTVAFGNADKYFRQSVYDAYVTDDWRIRPELTLNAGMRWEYGAPLTELLGRIVNLDVAPNFAAVAPVLGSDPKGPLTGASYPSSLVRPDKHGFEPRIGLSWRPIPASTLVVRAGYGIYDDTSIYLSSAESLAQQAPLSKSVSVRYTANCPLTLANGFFDCSGTTADTFAVDPDLRVGYAQAWQLSAQRDMPAAMVMTATYFGSKGTHGMQEFLPNTYAPGAVTPCPLCPVGFVYRTSNGNSTREAGSLQVRRRLRSGFTASLQYTYSKSVDDDAQVGAQGHVVATSAASNTSTSTPSTSPMIAQNWLDLRAERSLSSFDQRHLLTAQIQYTTGMGMAGGTLLNGWRGRLLKEWTALAQISAGSGLPETPVYLAAVPDTGVTGTIRPDLTGAPIRQTSYGHFLNIAAYSAPVAGQWGNAGRNSIIGPDQFTLDGSLARTFRLRDPLSLDVRLDATNLLNHGAFTAWNTTLGPPLDPTLNPTLNSPTFGLPASVNPMRSIQITGRLRF